MTAPIDRRPTAVDIHVGGRIRARRLELGLTQAALGRLVGRSIKQLRKIEHGRNRVGAGALYRIAAALSVSPQYFFEGIDGSPDSGDGAPADEARALLAEFHRIGTAGRRRAFLRLVKAIADSPEVQAQWAAEGAGPLPAGRPGATFPGPVGE